MFSFCSHKSSNSVIFQKLSCWGVHPVAKTLTCKPKPRLSGRLVCPPKLGNESNKSDLWNVQPVARTCPASTALAFRPTPPRADGERDTCLNTSHLHLYTLVWLGCPLSCGTCSLSPETPSFLTVFRTQLNTFPVSASISKVCSSQLVA